MSSGSDGARRPRPTQMTPYLSYLAERWAQGCHHARRLYQELIERGYRRSEGMARVVVRPCRRRQGISRQEFIPSGVPGCSCSLPVV